MNRLLKKHVNHTKSTLPEFVKHIYNFISEQSNNKERAHLQMGDWRALPDDPLPPTPTLSVCSDAIHESLTMDKSIIDAIWTKVAQLVHSTDGSILPIPGALVTKS